ncbi:uncharacterized protein A4U43_C10F7740 [Asparagus officinalis]|uniref:RING-type E3 ubiquitin transferase n=1 Tax=Asparagus officinalis TaxID=4686 RepID=A0A5P1E1L3_ASPOF|nr:uncharacterized protein A4U43_C10F7740 [Asparagus officinalis]
MGHRGHRKPFGVETRVNADQTRFTRALYRFAWLGCLLSILVLFCAKWFCVWFTNLHNSIRDDRYLIGRRLHSFVNDPVDKRNEQAAVIPQIQVNVNPIYFAGLIQIEQVADDVMRLRQKNKPHL